MAEYLQPEKKQEIFAKYGKSNKDTGSPEEKDICTIVSCRSIRSYSVCTG